LARFAHACGVEDAHGRAVPCHRHGDGVAGYPGLGAGQQTLLSDDLVDQGGFARVGAAHDRDAQRAGLGDLAGGVGVAVFDIHIGLGLIGAGLGGLDHRHQAHGKFGHPFPVFRRQRHGLAQSQFPRLDQARVGGRALRLVGGKDHRAARAAQDLGKQAVVRRDPGARVDQEEARVGHLHRAFAQAAHAALKAVVGGILKPGSVEDVETQVAQPRLALAQVARHAGLIVDKREFAPDKPVEEGRFAHIGAAYDGEGKAHGGVSVWKMRP
jgi:hypothetical protein